MGGGWVNLFCRSNITGIVVLQGVLNLSDMVEAGYEDMRSTVCATLRRRGETSSTNHRIKPSYRSARGHMGLSDRYEYCTSRAFNLN